MTSPKSPAVSLSQLAHNWTVPDRTSASDYVDYTSELQKKKLFRERMTYLGIEYAQVAKLLKTTRQHVYKWLHTKNSVFKKEVEFGLLLGITFSLRVDTSAPKNAYWKYRDHQKPKQREVI